MHKAIEWPYSVPGHSLTASQMIRVAEQQIAQDGSQERPEQARLAASKVRVDAECTQGTA